MAPARRPAPRRRRRVSPRCAARGLTGLVPTPAARVDHCPATAVVGAGDWLGGGAGVAMALLTTPWLSRRLVRRRRWAAASSPVEQAHAAWAELLDDAVDAGRPVPVSRSPRATATLLVEQVHSAPARAALRAVADAEERARYAPSMAGVGDLRAAVATIRRELFDPGDDAVRRLAVLFPRSVIRRSGSLAASMVADILDRLDGLAGLLRRRLPRLRRS